MSSLAEPASPTFRATLWLRETKLVHRKLITGCLGPRTAKLKDGDLEIWKLRMHECACCRSDYIESGQFLNLAQVSYNYIQFWVDKNSNHPSIVVIVLLIYSQVLRLFWTTGPRMSILNLWRQLLKMWLCKQMRIWPSWSWTACCMQLV